MAPRTHEQRTETKAGLDSDIRTAAMITKPGKVTPRTMHMAPKREREREREREVSDSS